MNFTGRDICFPTTSTDVAEGGVSYRSIIIRNYGRPEEDVLLCGSPPFSVKNLCRNNDAVVIGNNTEEVLFKNISVSGSVTLIFGSTKTELTYGRLNSTAVIHVATRACNSSHVHVVCKIID